MIRLTILDPSLNIPLPAADLLVKEINQYLPAYDQIVRAIHSKRDLHVVVLEKTVGNWLRILSRRYGAGLVMVEEISLKGQLSKQIGLAIPDEISDQQIKDSQLLDLSIPASNHASFEEYLLDIFFGNFLNSDGSMRRISDIVTSYEPDQWEAALNRPLVRELYFKRLHDIRGDLIAQKRDSEKILLDWLEESPQLLIRNLSALRMVMGYPDPIGNRLFGSGFIKIRDLKLDFRKVPIISRGNEKVLDEIRLYLVSKGDPGSIEEMNLLIEEMSGLLEIEFVSIYQILQKGRLTVKPDLIEKIRAKFKPIQEIPNISQALASLDLLITRDKPITPQADWSEVEWVKWATESYLPYRFWLENTGQLDDEIADIAGKYADWLYANYGNLNFHSNRMAWKWLLNLSNQWKQNENPVVVVMIDNLNAKFYPDLLHDLQMQGFYEQQMDYCFSMLPSCTEVSKKCVITANYRPFEGSSYKNPVENAWNIRLNKKILYVGSIGEFRALSKREHDIYFLNYLPLDITLHQNENQTGISHSQAVRSYLSSLAQDIRAFAERIGAERDLTVVIVSDHGSTRIPRGTINVIKGNYYRIHAEDEHHRYIAVKDEQIKKLPANNQHDCYFLNRKIMELDKNYLIARRLYRFLPTDENIYIHGGLTPEETLIPAAVYQPVVITPKPLSLNISSGSRIYVGTKFDLELEITNLNNYPCNNCVIELLDENLDTQAEKLGDIGKLIRRPVVISARCHRNADPGTRKLHLKVSFDFLGQQVVNDIMVPVEIIEPAKLKADLDNL